MPLSKKRFLLKFFWVTSFCALLPLILAWWKNISTLSVEPYQFPSPQVEALDRIVQSRLAVVPTEDFGFGRVGVRHSYFRPLTPPEKSSITALQTSKQDVVLYIVGRVVLMDDFGPDFPHVMQGPMYFTPGSKFQVAATAVRKRRDSNGPVKWQTRPIERKDLPSEEEIRTVAQQLFESADHKNGMTTTVGKWKVAAVPVRASQQACVDCHNNGRRWLAKGKSTWLHKKDNIKLRDPLGISLYFYQPSKQ
jgi:hypothetical protein